MVFNSKGHEISTGRIRLSTKDGSEIFNNHQNPQTLNISENSTDKINFNDPKNTFYQPY